MVMDPHPDRPTIQRSAPAKLNLALAVGPTRKEDGFHPICSWMATIDLADELLLVRLEDDRLSRYAILWHEEAVVPSAIDWSITRDLGVRAHQVLEREVGRALPIQMKLDKRIPVGGGLGGGSSDAAAVLLGVRSLFALDLDDATMMRLAHELGSDVPFFVRAGLSGATGSAVIAGLGEEVDDSPPVVGGGLLIVPDFGCATGLVYRAFDESPLARDPVGFDERVRLVRGLAERREPVAGLPLFNDLADPAARVAPRLRGIQATAGDIADRPVHLTGSGSACFVLLHGSEGTGEFEALRAELHGELEGCVVVGFRLG